MMAYFDPWWIAVLFMLVAVFAFLVSSYKRSHSKEKWIAIFFSYIGISTGVCALGNTNSEYFLGGCGLIFMFFSVFLFPMLHNTTRDPEELRRIAKFRAANWEKQKRANSDTQDFMTASGSGIMSNNSQASMSGRMSYDAVQSMNDTANHIRGL